MPKFTWRPQAVAGAEKSHWLYFGDERLLGRIVHDGEKWSGRLDGELPHVELGLFRNQSQAKQAVKTEVARRLKPSV